jgi:DNA-binding transcriptional LysR family regulator
MFTPGLAAGSRDAWNAMNSFDELFAENGLSLERLWTFDKVAAKDCSLIKAADNDPNRAALFCKQIGELKEFFGANLTHKVGKSVRLTPEGKELADIVRESFLKLADFKARCSKQPKHFSIGAGDSLLHWLVIPRLAVEAGAKDFSFGLHNLQNAEIINGLLDLTLDFGLARTSEAVQPLHRLPLGVKTYALYIPKALLGRSAGAHLDWRELLGTLPLVAQAKQTHFQREFEKRAQVAGIRLSISLYCETVPEVAQALRTERYAALLHGFASEELDPSRFQRVSLPFLKDLAFQIALVWNPKLLKIRRPSADKVRGLLTKSFKFSDGKSWISPKEVESHGDTESH